MKPYIANLINAIVLIAFGLWGYLTPESGEASNTALIAPAFGVILLICTPMVKKENKVVAHIAVLLTLLIILALAYPLIKAVSADPMVAMKVIRIAVMMLTSIIAMVAFVQSFIAARKARQ